MVNSTNFRLLSQLISESSEQLLISQIFVGAFESVDFVPEEYLIGIDLKSD